VREGFAAIKPFFPLFIVMIVAQFLISLLANFVPFIGSVLSSAVGACLVCGLFMAIFACFRNESPKLSMLFEGFSRFVPVVIFVLIQTIPFVIVASIVIANGMLPEELTANAGQEMTPEQLQVIISKIGAPLVAMYFAAWLGSMAIKAFLFFAMTLVADRDLSAPEAITLSAKAFVGNIGGVVLLMIVQTALFVGGMLLFFVGLLLTAPLIYAAEAAAYRQVFGLKSAPPSVEIAENV
jgi:hypothetical protein